ncbi:adenylate/guanylate cyclase domain-containing protein [Pseudorhodoferax sp. Leaf267]|uniref:adenylate/guanylate cyclase domain-containing protein n=1 Tax=Pseudorhodoferax sp. Leaf267 TaxID=1736316 RepID=UPI0006F3F262|nr:adenylate/guanylate cyclase domain-containing protein [Pseudorhodoferax sp. Leaf267]KQP21995.1 adenylate cyclase [Pseudorhodoferax sp. Leaf267]
MNHPDQTSALASVLAVLARETRAPVAPAVHAELAAILNGGEADSAPVQLSVEQREVTILVADLRGFTALTATQPAGTIVTMLNLCLSRLSEVVFRYEGTIDKFSGDSLTVLFGAPTSREDDVLRALCCAVEMQQAMLELNNHYLRRQMPELHLGIGVNTGQVMAGRFGSAAYSEYAVIGNQVSLASRIESFSMRGQVLISENTYARSNGVASATEPKDVFVAGKSLPVQVRELIAIASRRLKVPRQEFRRSHRVEVRVPCRFRMLEDGRPVGEPQRALIRDVGYHGLLLELERPLAHQVEVSLDFDLTLVDYHVGDIRAKIAKVKREGEHLLAGLEFTAISAETNAKIQMFVQLLVGAG